MTRTPEDAVDAPDAPLLGYLRGARPIAVRAHLPVGAARAGVVLCPPLGHEEFNSRRSFRRLGEQLKGRSIASVSIDYDGTGDSAGSFLDPGRVTAWLDSIATAVEALRTAGASRVVLVGLRVGALLAANAARSVGADALVLWDPVVSGRAFLRSQRALFTFGLFGATAPSRERDDWVEGPGLLLDRANADELARLGLASDPGYDGPVLVVHRDQEPAAKLLGAYPGRSVTWLATDEQPALIDAESWQAKAPVATLDGMTAWVERHAGDETPFHADAMGLVQHVRIGAVTETATSLTAARLAAIVTEPAAGGASGVTVVFLNTSVEHHTGPGRLWVDLSREWAALGARCVRVDLGGLGDSPTAEGETDDAIYPPSALGDVRELAELYDGRAVFVGLCSGGYHAIEAALQTTTAGVIALNPYLGVGGDLTDEPALRRSAVRLGGAAQRRLSQSGYVLDRMPAWSWRLLTAMRLYTPPTAALEPLVERAPDTLVLLGDADAYPLYTRGGGHLGRLQAQGIIDVRTIEGLDHGLLLAEPRVEVARTLTDFVRRRWLDEAAA